MNKRKSLIFTCVLLGVIAMAGLSACSDDHYEIDGTLAGKGTVWQNISTRPELSEFADILSAVHYSTSETAVTNQTYADLLNHDQTFTVWAPKNGSFNYPEWKAMLQSGDREQIYKVEFQLVRNCMTRYSHVLTGDKVEDVMLFNRKNGNFNCPEMTINETSITTANIGATNGVLHITDGNIEFLPNIYEYLASKPELSKLNDFIKKYEEIEFDEYGSTQGPTIDGNITWVDSVTNLTNTYFNYLNAYINREDSTYMMVMPTNECWDKEYERMKSYFNYIPQYIQKVITVNPSDLSTSEETFTTTYTDVELDSINDFRTCDAIARNLCFNEKWQFGHNHLDMVKEGACDSIESTSRTVFYDPYSAAIFNNVEPVRLSNGYGYVVDKYNYRLQDTWLEEKRFEAERTVESYDYCNTSPTRIYIANPWSYLPAEQREGINITDTVIELNALTLEPTRSTANTSALFKAPNTLSCKYDIVAVMVYNVSMQLPYQFRAYVNYHEGGSKATQTRTQLKPEDGVNGSGNYFQTKPPHVDEKGMLQFNDSVVLAKDFQFPVSYYGMDDAYVTVEIQSYMTSTQRSQFTNELIIDKIIFIPKENE